jgi:hypothetical protein
MSLDEEELQVAGIFRLINGRWRTGYETKTPGDSDSKGLIMLTEDFVSAAPNKIEHVVPEMKFSTSLNE